MATKVMKIGLSTADKNTMSSQVALETINKLIDAYSTSKQYAVGDYVNNSGIIYVCIEATSGAWDSTKWSVSTLNQVIDKINSAAASVNNKAEKDGYYETFGYARESGIAKNLQNDEGKLLDPDVDTSSGTTYADQPFTQRATAMTMKAYLDNELITVGSGYEQWRKEQAFSIVRNQYVNFVNTSTSQFGITYDYSVDGTITANGTSIDASSTTYFSNIQCNIIAGHTYIFLVEWKNNNADIDAKFIVGGATSNLQYTELRYNQNGIILKATTNGTNPYTILRIPSGKTVSNLSVKVKFIDLTQWFASRTEIATALNGDAGVKWFLQNYPEALSLDYDTGTIVDTEDYDYETTGVNLFDEQWETGSISTTTGENVSSNIKIRSKNYTSIFPNTPYYFMSNSASGDYVYWYDINKNFIICNWLGNSNVVITSPSNAAYFRFINNSTTYKNDIQICQHFTETSVEQTYHKYEIFKDRVSWSFTSTGKGKSAGNVADTKDYVNKKNIEKVGTYTFTGNETTIDRGTNQVGNQIYVIAVDDFLPYKLSRTTKAICNKAQYLGITTGTSIVQGESDGKGIRLYYGETHYVYFIGYTLQEIIGMTINFELATYIESDMEGDEYDTNIPENDYGVERKVSVSGNMFSGSSTTIFYQDNVLRQIYNNKSAIDNLQEELNTIEARIPIAPTTDGNYTLKAVVSNGVATYSWELDSQGE